MIFRVGLMGWMVAVSEAGATDLLRESFEDNGNEHYLPVIRERVVSRGRRYWKESYLFGRYTFVKSIDGWEELFQLRGLAEIFTTASGKPSIVPDKIIERIRQQEVNGYVRLGSRFAVGQRIKMIEGPLFGLEGQYQGTGKIDHDAVLLRMLGGWTRAEVPSSSIAANG